MRQQRSAPEESAVLVARPLPAPVALAATVLGVAAMTLAPVAGFRVGGLRGQVALGTVLLALPALLALAARPGGWRSAVGSARVSGRLLAAATALGAGVWVASAGLMELQSLVAPPPPEYLELFRQLHRALAPSGPLDALVSLIVIAALPGVCEELLVRGALLPSLLGARVPILGATQPGSPGTLGSSGALAVSSILFAAMHLDAYRFLFTLSVGVMLGWVRLRTGSLWPSVLAHVTLNTLTFLVAPLVDDPSKPYTPEPLLGIGALAVGALVCWPLLRALRASGPGDLRQRRPPVAGP